MRDVRSIKQDLCNVEAILSGIISLKIKNCGKVRGNPVPASAGEKFIQKKKLKNG